MSQAETRAVAEQLDEDEIATYLEQNPRFLERHPEVLETLEMQHQSGSAASLIERQVNTLRETNRTLQQRYSQLVDTARNNEQRVNQINRLAQVFVGMVDIDSFVTDFSQVAKDELNVDHIFVGLDSEDAVLPNDIHRLPPDTDASRALTNVFRRGKPIVGALEEQQIHALFGADSDSQNRIESAAMIPLGKRATSGALVLGSTDPERFVPDMGTLFLELTGQLATTALRRLLGSNGPA
ncbi:DUF484 family protein [Salinisphaera sp. USBA-960]|uniref:DUF484 family protein n=1 Tax=Salinisphaera orenii TaxID=856731 RepID=UPI000DBE10FF|nr:DUF484 family protein [Salifodinibacter halophilus]NNC25347.1 DUF484 family protein [Salifodinibacter halophilus]